MTDLIDPRPFTGDLRGMTSEQRYEWMLDLTQKKHEREVTDRLQREARLAGEQQRRDETQARIAAALERIATALEGVKKASADGPTCCGEHGLRNVAPHQKDTVLWGPEFYSFGTATNNKDDQTTRDTA